MSGGFVEHATTAVIRSCPPLDFLPERGRFQFPAPYNTEAIRITNMEQEMGSDALLPTGYSYWPGINAHEGQPIFRVFLCITRDRGGPGPVVYTVTKATGSVAGPAALFAESDPLSWQTGEGWYWSRTDPEVLYCSDQQHLYRLNVLTGVRTTVVDTLTADLDPDGTKVLWQWHTSANGRVHSATLKDGSTYAKEGVIVYREGAPAGTSSWEYIPKIGTLDEAQVDESGEWLLIKENVDEEYGEDNRIIYLGNGSTARLGVLRLERRVAIRRSPAGLRQFRARRAARPRAVGPERVILDQGGAAGHSDNGYGYMVAADNWNDQPGAIRVWPFDGGQSPQGRLVYHTPSWDAELNHLSHRNARRGASEVQYVVGSGASRTAAPRNNEIVGFRLDGSLEVVVIAPVMTDLDAPGGGSDDYNKLPKGNLDPYGELFLWTSNAGGNRLDAFVVQIPTGLFGQVPPEPVCTHSCPVHCEPAR